MIPVRISEDEQVLLGPDELVGVVDIKVGEGVEIRPWWPKRERAFREPRWYEARWCVSRDVGVYRMEKDGSTYFRAGSVWMEIQQGVRNFVRYRRRMVSKRKMKKLGLSVEGNLVEVQRRVVFGVERLYGVRSGRVIVFRHEGKWKRGTVESYEMDRDMKRVEKNRESKVRKRRNRWLRQPTWLERLLRD